MDILGDRESLATHMQLFSMNAGNDCMPGAKLKIETYAMNRWMVRYKQRHRKRFFKSFALKREHAIFHLFLGSIHDQKQ